jgi:hypothetical protein
VAAKAGIYTWAIIFAWVVPVIILAWWRTEEQPRREARKAAGWKLREPSEVLDEYEKLLKKQRSGKEEEESKE